MKREDLLKSREYWIAKIQIDLYNIIEGYIKERGISRTQLANELNVTKGYVSQVLNGDFDHKISKLVDLTLAIGKVPILTFEDFKQYCEDDELGLTNISINERPIIELKFNDFEDEKKETDTEITEGWS